MSDVAVRTLGAVDVHGWGLKVEFFRMGPRWAHRLLAVENHVARPLLQSVEGDEQQSFPPSPALQQLDFQKLPGGVAVGLLIGMAGRNHWSVGVEAFAEQRRIRFDVACRNQPCSVGQLGSAYQTLTPWQLAADGHPVATIEGATIEGIQCELVPQHVDGGGTLDVIGPSVDLLTLRAAVVRASPTQRWCYEFRLSPPPRP